MQSAWPRPIHISFMFHCGAFSCWFLCIGGIDTFCFFILSIQTIMTWWRKPFYSTTQDRTGTSKVKPSFRYQQQISAQIRTSFPQRAWAHHEASALGLQPRWWEKKKTVAKCTKIIRDCTPFCCNDSITGWWIQGRGSYLLCANKAPNCASWCLVAFI